MIDIDDYFQHRPGWLDRMQTRAALKVALRGCRLRPDDAQQWAVSRLLQPGNIELLSAHRDGMPAAWSADQHVAVSTVRMGYGHHRIALGVSSWAQPAGKVARFLDLLEAPRDEARAIERLDGVYSFMSRLASNLGGPLERFWGRLMQSGGVGSARLVSNLAANVPALLGDVPRDVPFVSAYPLNGHLAVQLGFERVVNLIFDNDPQHFLIVPGALNVVQTSASYERLRQLGVPRDEVALAGHWVGRELVENLEDDCAARISRAERSAPRRLLISIGGAGAQRRFVGRLLRALRPLMWAGEVRVLLNLGDHERLREPFEAIAGDLRIDWEPVHGARALETFCASHPLGDHVDGRLLPLTIFSSDDRLEAVQATDRLLRLTDVLVTKPSELAFVPVPKLHIRRVGDHEAASARRSAELGDGTLECREIGEAFRMAVLLSKTPELVGPMNERIISNARRGVYDGSRRALELAANGTAGRKTQWSSQPPLRAA
jgi:hypothetical protein